MYQTFEKVTCRDGAQRRLLLAACILVFLPATARAQDFGGYPHPVTNPASGLMLDLPGTGTDPTAINYGALPVLSGAHSVISQGDPTWQFRLHNYMAYHDDKFWMMWSHGPSIEDKPTQHVRYVTSADGVNWSAEQMVVGPSNQSNFRYIARGFWQREGELYALASHDEAGGYFGANLELRGFQWNQSTAQWDSVGMLADDTINNFEPKQLPSGEWMMSRRGNNYSNDPNDRSWLIGGVNAIDDWENSPIPVAANNARLEEPNFHELPDGNLVSLYRDNSGSKRLYRSFSNDDGQSWSQPVPTNFPDATAKFYDLKTSRGYYLLFSNANPASRNPLTMSISQDGLVYTQMAKLDIPGGGSFQYPHAIERDGEIYVAFSRNKTSIELMRISLDSIDAILDYVPEPQPYQGLFNGDFENTSATFPRDWTIVRPTPAAHAGLGGSTTAAYLAKQSDGGARIMQGFASPGPEWELDLLFATEDPGDSDERSLNIIMQNSVGGGNLNLRVNGDGSVQTVASSPTTAWFDIPNLSNLVEFSTDANGDGDFSDAQDTLNVHRLLLRGDFTTGSPEYTVFLSAANSTELGANGAASRWFGGSPGEGGSVSNVTFSAQSSGGSFVVDQVQIRQLGALPGDYNGDGQVDAADYTAWRDSRGSTSNLAADGDGSGSVNQADYQLWKKHFGNQSASTANTSVPEPSAWRLLATSCLFISLLRPFRVKAIANTRSTLYFRLADSR